LFGVTQKLMTAGRLLKLLTNVHIRIVRIWLKYLDYFGDIYRLKKFKNFLIS